MILGVTGASGFIGSRIVDALAGSTGEIRCLVRGPVSDLPWKNRSGIQTITGDLRQAKSLEEFTKGLDALVHCAAKTSEGRPDSAESQAVNVEGTRLLIDACLKGRCRRFIHISSQSARPSNPTAYGHTKWLSEEAVRGSTLDFTILRPHTVYGPGTRGLFWKIVGLIRRLGIVPIIGPGREQFQPVHVDDVVQAVQASLMNPVTVGRTYDLGGADVVTFSRFVDAIAKEVGSGVFQVHLPVPLCRWSARAMAPWMASPPLTLDNIAGLTQMTVSDNQPAIQDFGYHPLGLEAGLRSALRSE